MSSSATLALAALTAAVAAVFTASDPTGASDSDRSLVERALQAAPPGVGAAATVVAVEGAGNLRTLRRGANGFTCMADNPATSGRDPMCMDPAALAWIQAWLVERPPPAGRVGFIYLLRGTTRAANTDPFAPVPPPDPGEIGNGPHVLIVGADPAFYAMYPKGADSATPRPYVVGAGTPYPRLRIPVQ